MDKKEQKEEKKVISLDTISKIGEKITLANREYTIVPISVRDMYIVTKNLLLLPIAIKGEEEIADYVYAINVTDEEKEKVFYEMVEKYLRYEKNPVTKELIEEHNWTFSDIKNFLKAWLKVSD